MGANLHRFATIDARAEIIGFEIIDRHTGKVVATAKTRAGANRAVDRRDNEYGAYRYSARAIWSDRA